MCIISDSQESITIKVWFHKQFSCWHRYLAVAFNSTLALVAASAYQEESWFPLFIFPFYGHHVCPLWATLSSQIDSILVCKMSSFFDSVDMISQWSLHIGAFTFIELFEDVVLFFFLRLEEDVCMSSSLDWRRRHPHPFPQV